MGVKTTAEQAPQQAKNDLLALDDLLLDSSEASCDSLFICSVFEGQRPLKGVAGALDWRLRGFLSRFVKEGRISGRPKEFVYIPIRRYGRISSLMLVGLGKQPSVKPTTAQALPPSLVDELCERIRGLNRRKVTISRSSFPALDETKLRRALEGVEVELTQ